MNDKIKINLQIADSNYPLTINREEEQMVREAAKQVNVRLNKYREVYKNLEPEKIIAMVAYQFSLEKLQLMQRNDTSPYVEKVKERHTRHTRKVKSGKTYHTQVYYTWDRVESEDKKCKKINFCGIDFESKKIEFPDADYIETIKESSHVRYKYYGVPTKHTGTIYTHLEDKTILDNSPFYKDCTIDEALDKCTSGAGNVIFWIAWVLLICGCVYGFYYAENRWLE